MQPDMESPTSAQAPQAKRPRRWPVILVLVLIVIAGGAGIAWHQLGGKLKSTEPYKLTLAQVQKDPQVIAQLGEPIRDAEILPSGSVYGDKANVMFRIAGPKGRASVRAEARRIGGKWGLAVLDVITADQKRLSLSTGPGAGGEGDAPTWKPKSGAAPKTEVEAPKIPPPSAPGPDIQLDMPAETGEPGK
jgi:hypothetical protein